MNVKKMLKLYTVPLVFLSVFSLFSGCEEDKKPLKQTPKIKVAAVDVKEITAKETVIQKASEPTKGNLIYDPGERLEPFEPLVKVTSVRGKSSKKNAVAGTLESYDIADFKLLAILEKEGQEFYGLLLSPDNKSFTIKKETVLGLHKGKVKGITSRNVVLIEYVKDYRGELKPREIVLELHKEEVE